MKSSRPLVEALRSAARSRATGGNLIGVRGTGGYGGPTWAGVWQGVEMLGKKNIDE